MAAERIERSELEAAIAALETQRATLGDSVVDLALGPLRQRLAALDPPAPMLKQVTILFVDMVGSTAVASALDPEDVDELMDGLLRRCSEVIELHRGRVFNYTGDGLLGVFGADEAREDDSELAVRAALAILEEAAWMAGEVSARFGIDGVSVRLGIDTGPVLLGGSLEGDRNIRGNAVNVAARMEQSAPVGGLRISLDTYRLVRGVFDVTEQPPITVKGVAEPVSTYLVHGVKPRSFRVTTRGIEGIETPMVGREDELDRLCRALSQVRLERRLRAVTVVADPGMGKSRLLYEFENWAEVQPDSYVMFKGRAQPHTRHQPYGLLRDLLAWRLQIADTDDADTARQRFEQGTAPWFDPGDQASVHLLGHLIGLDYRTSPHVVGIQADPAQIRSRAVSALVGLLRRMASDWPLLWLLEDLHWADDDTLDALAHLSRAHFDLPILVVGTTRPELTERRPDWLDPGAPQERIALAALPDDEVDVLVGALLQRVAEVPPQLRQVLANRGDGNPFFIEEIVKMLLDEGALSANPDGSWHVAPDRLGRVQVPTTLMGVLQARFDGLAASERAALQQASVIGYLFWDRAVGALDAHSPESLDPLASRGFVNRQPDSTIADAREFTFQHHLLQQFTYESVLKRDRQRYHARAAAWLSELAASRGSEFLGAIAEHHERAGQIDLAIDHFVRAAESAAARASRTLAVEHAERALALSPTPMLRWRALVARESVAALGDDPVAHDAVLDLLSGCAEHLDDDAARAAAALRRAVALIDRADHLRAESVALDALRFAESAGQVRLAALACAELSRTARRTNRPSECLAHAERGLELAETLGDPRVNAQLLMTLSSAKADLGETGRISLARQALHLAEQAGDRMLQASILNSLGGGYDDIGDADGARRAWERGAALAHELEWTYGESITTLNLAGAASASGDNSGAVELARRAITLAQASGSRDLEAAATMRLGIAQRLLGEPEARVSLERCRDLFIANDGPHYAMEPTAALALLDLDEGDGTSARSRIDEVLAFCAAGGSLDGLDDPFRVRWECFTVLDRLGDPRAPALLAEAHALLVARSAELPDGADVTAFLHASAAHRSLLEAWDRAGRSGAGEG